MDWAGRLLFGVLLLGSICGCQETAQVANSGGKFVGEVLSVPAAASEGVAEGYGQVGAEENPYNR